MPSDFPKGDPRLQKVNPGPRVAIGQVDSCIVYLETTLPGEIPLLAACWASSSQEIRTVGSPSTLELTNVVIIGCRGRRTFSGKFGWNFISGREQHLVLKYHDTGCPSIVGFPLWSSLEQTHRLNFQWAIRFIDHETNASLRTTEASGKVHALAKHILKCPGPDWVSITDALAYLAYLEPALTHLKPEKTKPAKIPAKSVRSKSLLRRFISSVFKKKQMTVGA
jgi:hypothetical protein